MSDANRSELIPTRHSLLERLRKWDDQESWQLFFDTYWKLIYRTARQAGLKDNEAEEAVQETVISVARKMPDFKYRPAAEGGSFKSWLLRLAKWRINDQLRKRRRDHLMVSGGSTEGDVLSEIPDPLAGKLEELWNNEWEQNLLDAALEQVKKAVQPRDFQVFDLSAVKGWSCSKVSQFLNVNLAQVYLIRHRVSKKLKNTLETLSKEP